MSLLNLGNVPNNEICGLSDEMLNWVTTESCDRYITELTKGFQEELENMEVYEDLDDETLKMLREVESKVIPQSTQKQTRNHIKRFKEFLVQKKLSDKIETAPLSILGNYLSFFYYSLETKEQKPYSPASLICFRASIQRYLNSPTVNRNINLVDDPHFKRANGVLKAMVKKWMSFGSERSVKYDSICKNDLIKIKEYFTRDSPQVLQEEAWFTIVYYLALRGREVLHDLPKSALEFAVDTNGKSFVFINSTYITKNVKVSLSSKEFENISQARIYETEVEKHCPVSCLKEYFSRIPPNCDLLFPIPIKKFLHKKFWYCLNRSLGVNTIGSFMKNISKNAKLDAMYTNHCVRVTVVSTLKDNGLPCNDIAAVTGHKNIQSVEKYVRRKSDIQKRSVSQMLSCGMDSSHSKNQNDNNSMSDSTLIHTRISRTQFEQIQMNDTSKYAFVASTNKKMKIEACAENNVITITFD